MSQVAIKQDLPARDTLDILGAFQESRIPVKVIKQGSETLIGYLSSIRPTHYGLLSDIAFVPGKHVRSMKGKCHQDFLFRKNGSKWEVVKHE